MGGSTAVWRGVGRRAGEATIPNKSLLTSAFGHPCNFDDAGRKNCRNSLIACVIGLPRCSDVAGGVVNLLSLVKTCFLGGGAVDGVQLSGALRA